MSGVKCLDFANNAAIIECISKVDFLISNSLIEIYLQDNFFKTKNGISDFKRKQRRKSKMP